jgi:phosphonate degradation associated HDIG domain protein
MLSSLKTLSPSLDTLVHIYHTRGAQQYGQEAVSQLEHALQCATLAEQDSSSPEMIAACLLHDLGHLVHDLGEDAHGRNINDRHEYRALKYLEPLFGPAVTEPVRLHVDAKRYLCAIDSRYWETLSPVSKQTLELQGGSFSIGEATAFLQLPHADDAVRLRLWDDRAKVPGYLTPDLEHFVPILSKCLRQ